MKTLLKSIIVTSILSVAVTAAFSQTVSTYADEKGKEADKTIPKPFDKKFFWGLSYNQLWSTIKGDNLEKNYFVKPSIGFLISAEYFPKSFIGVSVGAGYQQRGAGILNPNKQPVTGLDPDSTHRERLRFNTIEIPLAVILRTPKDVIPGIRFSASVGIVPMFNVKSKDVFNELEAGIRNVSKVTDVSSSYFKNDLAYQLSIGPEINSGTTGIFKVHFLYSKGTKNVYTNTSYKGYNQTLGIRVSWIF